MATIHKERSTGGFREAAVAAWDTLRHRRSAKATVGVTLGATVLVATDLILQHQGGTRTVDAPFVSPTATVNHEHPTSVEVNGQGEWRADGNTYAFYNPQGEKVATASTFDGYSQVFVKETVNGQEVTFLGYEYGGQVVGFFDPNATYTDINPQTQAARTGHGMAFFNRAETARMAQTQESVVPGNQYSSAAETAVSTYFGLNPQENPYAEIHVNATPLQVKVTSDTPLTLSFQSTDGDEVQVHYTDAQGQTLQPGTKAENFTVTATDKSGGAPLPLNPLFSTNPDKGVVPVEGASK